MYDGPVYSVGQAYLLPINDTVIVNYEYMSSECFVSPQTKLCSSEFGMTVAGIVLLSIAGLNLTILCCVLSCGVCVLFFMRKK